MERVIFLLSFYFIFSSYISKNFRLQTLYPKGPINFLWKKVLRNLTNRSFLGLSTTIFFLFYINLNLDVSCLTHQAVLSWAKKNIFEGLLQRK